MALITFSLFLLPSWSYADISESERAALIALYNATDGDNWTNNTNWKQMPLESDGFGAYGTEGNWYGVSVESDAVIQLNLDYNQLSGTIPAEIRNLSKLKTLWLQDNQLSGSIPSELGNLSNLETLLLSINQLSGSIPAGLGDLSNLIELQLNSNQLSGSIPSELGNLSNLETLCFEGNQLSGSIPSELGNLPNLTALDLAYNELSGNIPGELGNLSNLKSLLLHLNQLSGSIPSELGNLSNLVYLVLGYNQLSGSIPSELGDLPNLKMLYLTSNQLSGSIPGELGNLSNLNELKLYGNQLQGAIPDALKNLTQLDDNVGLDLGVNNCLYIADFDDGSLQAFIDLKAGEGWEDGAQCDCESLQTAIAIPHIYVNTNSPTIYRNETLKVYFNTAVLPSMTEQYDVYFRISWDDEVLYDNGSDLTKNPEPLSTNYVIPNLSSWLENKRLTYKISGDEQIDFTLGLYLVNGDDEIVFVDYSTFQYFPEDSPFIETSDSRIEALKSAKSDIKPLSYQTQADNSNTCHLGGIKADADNLILTELDSATKRSMRALQFGSAFDVTGNLKNLYNGVKGAYNLLKSGEKICEHINDFEEAFDDYEYNIEYGGLTQEQATNLLAIDFLTQALHLADGYGLYSGFDENDLMNGIKEFYKYQNGSKKYIASLTNSANISIRFKQPWKLFGSKDREKLNVTLTPVFLYPAFHEGEDLKTLEKIYITFDDIRDVSMTYNTSGDSTDDTPLYSNAEPSYDHRDSTLKCELTRGLYLIKATTSDGEEVFRDTIHVIMEGQEYTMLIDR